MKNLLTSTALSLLLISLASVSYGQPDFEETKLRAEQGDPFAQFNLGIMYELGDSIPQNYSEAVRWYRAAAQLGNDPAMYNLAIKLEDGIGVQENDVEAALWYRISAEHGYIDSQYNLGLMYFYGNGVPENHVRAYMWWSVAAAQGYERAKTNRDILIDRLTPDQLARGQDMATRCFESDYQDCE